MRELTKEELKLVVGGAEAFLRSDKDFNLGAPNSRTYSAGLNVEVRKNTNAGVTLSNTKTQGQRSKNDVVFTINHKF